MAFTTVTVSNGKEFKQVPLGFSWTMFFFGPFPAFARKDWGVGVILLFLCVFSFNAIGMIGAFFYNKVYARKIFDQGYRMLTVPEGIPADKVARYLGREKIPYM